MKPIADSKPPILMSIEKADHHSRRTKYDIWSEILDSCAKTQRTKFWLTSRLGISWKVVNESLIFLTTANLIESTKHQREKITKYKTTIKGQEALNAYRLLLTKYFCQ